MVVADAVDELTVKSGLRPTAATPDTERRPHGVEVPMPTLPELSIRTLSEPFEEKSSAPAVGENMPALVLAANEYPGRAALELVTTIWAFVLS